MAEKMKRISLYVDEEDRQGIRVIREKMTQVYGVSSDSAAVRQAVRKVAFGDDSLPPISKHTRKSPKE